MLRKSEEKTRKTVLLDKDYTIQYTAESKNKARIPFLVAYKDDERNSAVSLNT